MHIRDAYKIQHPYPMIEKDKPALVFRGSGLSDTKLEAIVVQCLDYCGLTALSSAYGTDGISIDLLSSGMEQTVIDGKIHLDLFLIPDSCGNHFN